MELSTVKEIGEDNERKMTLRIPAISVMLSILSSVVSAIGVGVFFYFNTNYTLANHTEKLDNLEMRVGKVESNLSDMKTDVSTVKTDINYLKLDVIEIKESQKQTQLDIREIYKVVTLKK